MSDAILDHGGTLVSYMGDGIMAVFGAPLEQADHADRALRRRPRDARARLPAFNAWLREQGFGDGFRMGIGLNSGAVMSGNVGSERRLEYTAIGDTTNTASRLEGMTKGTPLPALRRRLDPGAARRAARRPRLRRRVRGARPHETMKVWSLRESEAPAGDADGATTRPGGNLPMRAVAPRS